MLLLSCVKSKSLQLQKRQWFAEKVVVLRLCSDHIEISTANHGCWFCKRYSWKETPSKETKEEGVLSYFLSCQHLWREELSGLHARVSHSRIPSRQPQLRSADKENSNFLQSHWLIGNFFQKGHVSELFFLIASSLRSAKALHAQE